MTEAAHEPDFRVIGFSDFAEIRRRLPRLLIGLVCLGAGIGLSVRARLGLSPWDVLHQGLSERLGVNFGLVVIGLGVIILLLWIPLRQRPGFGTVLNTLSVGLIADLVLELTPRLDSMVARWVAMLLGVLVVAIGIGLYIGAGLGPGPRDGLMTSIAARGHPVWAVRTALELSALAAGWLLGGTVGVGTVVFALGIGPLGHWFLNRFHLGVDAVDPDPDATFGE